MKDIAIAGAGGFGRETAWLIRQINQAQPAWNLLGYYDDRSEGVQSDGLPVIGKIGELNDLDQPLALVIAIADPSIRRSIVQKIVTPFISYPSLFHPACDRGDERCVYGKGCIITNGCIITINVRIGDFVIINLGTSVGHDVSIGGFSSVMPDCSISGFVSIGEDCQIGAGVRILPGLGIGNKSVVGAGAVVTRNFGSHAKLIGVPAANIAEHVERI